MRRLLGVLLLAVLCLLLVQHWYSPHGMAERREARLARPGDELVVGVDWPFAEEHDGFSDGARLAQEEINGAGGMRVRLVPRNSQGDLGLTRDIAMAFSRDPSMSAVIGYRDDSGAIRASALYERSHLLQLVAGSTSTALSDHGNPYLVQTLVSADKVARSLAQAGGGRRYALVWEKDSEADALVSEYRIAQDSRGASLGYHYAFNDALADFKRPVSELKTLKTDVILFAGRAQAASAFLSLTNAAGLQQTIICACTVTPELKALAGAGPGRTLLLDFYDAGAPGAVHQGFVARYTARYGRQPDTWAAQAYDALKLLDLARKASGSRRADDLALALRSLPAWEGANGWYQFSKAGAVANKPVFLKRYHNGEPLEVIAALGVADTLRRPATGSGAVAVPVPEPEPGP